MQTGTIRMSPTGGVFASASNAQAGGTGETFPEKGNVALDTGDVGFFGFGAVVPGTGRRPNYVGQLARLQGRGLTPRTHHIDLG